jgi:hypothetical protein
MEITMPVKLEEKMEKYIVKRINMHKANGLSNMDIVEQLAALDSRRGVERLIQEVEGQQFLTLKG